jgi:dTDP-glucose pyrophosphorylase/predicted transcriptional regulator
VSKIDWAQSLLNHKKDMKSAITNLESGQSRIVMVIDDNERLVGTVTDGDIRRAILCNLSMESKVTEFMNSSPTSVDLDMEKESILKIMKSKEIMQIPIVDKDKKVVGLETFDQLLEKKRIENPVFLMAGGFGTRLAPLTNKTPKPLLKIGSKTILERILQKFIDSGFTQFYISTHFMADKIRDYFGDGSNWNISIQYIHEDKPLGTGGALGLLPKNEIDKPLIMMNGDLLSKVNFLELLHYHEEKKGKVTACVSEYELQIPYGVVVKDEHKFLKIDEKPSHKFFINAGIYVVDPSIIYDLDGSNFLDMPTLLNQITAQNLPVNVFPIHEYWLDIGQHDDFDRAKKDLIEEE